MSIELLYSRTDRARQIIIVRVEPGYNIALRMRKAFVNSFCLTIIFFTGPPGKARGIFMNDVQTAIRRAAVHDKIFDIPIILFENGVDRAFQEGCLVEGWSDDGN